MTRFIKIGWVVGGYGLALLAGTVAGYLYDVRMSKLPYDTSGGMYAGGQALTSLAAFLVVALVPTLLALWFLRRNKTLWQLIAFAALTFAVLGLLAVILFTRGTPTSIGAVLFSLLGLAHLLGAPLWTLAFVIFALMAPTPTARRVLVVATGLELVIGTCALLHWLMPGSPI